MKLNIKTTTASRVTTALLNNKSIGALSEERRVIGDKMETMDINQFIELELNEEHWKRYENNGSNHPLLTKITNAKNSFNKSVYAEKHSIMIIVTRTNNTVFIGKHKRDDILPSLKKNKKGNEYLDVNSYHQFTSSLKD